MSKVILTIDGKMYVGRSAGEAVCRMRESGIFTVGKTDDEYMTFVSRRSQQLHGATIRHDTPEHFLADMASNHIIELKEF
ncbi:MAG: hypothetical protein ACR2IJ_07955 [Fluviibacter sp.]|jgi:hypothetical protein